MTHPLGYDPDPSNRGEGSSTGTTRRRTRAQYNAANADPDTTPLPLPARKRRAPMHARVTAIVHDNSDAAATKCGGLCAEANTTPHHPALPRDLPPPIPATHPICPPRLVGGGRPRRAQRVANGTSGVKPGPTPRATRAARATRSRRTSATPTTLESIAAESAAIRAEVARLGLALRDVTADGNCLFRALGDQLWGDQSKHKDIRRMVCDHLERARDELGDFVAGFLNEGEDYDAYVRRMRGDAVYGSHIELLAASKVFQRSIRIVLAQTSYTVEYIESAHAPIAEAATGPRSTRATRRARKAAASGVETPTPLMVPDNTPAGASPVPEAQDPNTPPPPREGQSMLWLALFAEAEHYESVRRKGERSYATGPAGVPDALAVPHARDESEAARRERGEEVAAAPNVAAKGATGRLAEVLASLPTGHGIAPDAAAGVLARTKGDVSAAVEILLQDLDLDASDIEVDAASDGSAAVEAMLRPVSPDPALAYRERDATPSSSEDPASPASTAPTSPLDSEVSEGESDYRPDAAGEEEERKVEEKEAEEVGGRRLRVRRGAKM